MKYVSDVVAKNDPIALYYKMILDKKLNQSQTSSNEDKKRLEDIFSRSPEWIEKTKTLGLNFDQI